MSVDKLVFTFDVVPTLRETFRRQMHRVGFPHWGGRIYRESLEIEDPGRTGEKILVQCGPYLLSSVPFARVEFNPAKVEGEREILRRLVEPFLRRGWASAHITRVDVAVDYGVALQDHVYYAGNHKGNLYYSRDGIETVYLGSAQSNSRGSYPLTRIEAQRRSTGLAAARLDGLPNPFRRLRVARPTPAGLPFRYLLYFQDAEKHGVDSVLKRLGRCERKRFKRYLAEMPATIDHPSLVLAQKAEHAGVSIQFDQGFSDALPYPDSSFDRVLSSFMFHHLQSEDKEKMLRQARRVLKPGGTLHMLESHNKIIFRWWAITAIWRQLGIVWPPMQGFTVPANYDCPGLQETDGQPSPT